MEISWLGHGCFRLRGRDVSVVTDPCAPSTGYKIGKLSADVVTLSNPSPDANFRQALQGTPKFLNGPGEYDVAGALITAVRTGRHADGSRGTNVAFVIDIDDVRICHLGELNKPPSADDVEQLGSADILILPVGGGHVLSAAAAAETVSLMEPKIVIPMIYKTDVSTAPDLEPIEKFLKELGSEAKAPEAKLTITKNTIPSDTTLVLLSYRG